MSDNEPVMSGAQREALGTWCRKVMNRLRLTDHALIVLPEPPERDPVDDVAPWASVTCSPYPQSTLRVDATLFGEDTRLIEQKLLHEIVHMYHGDMIPAVLEMIDDEGDSKRAEVVLRRYVEHMVDQVSRVIQEKVDLPPIGPILKAEKPTPAGPV